MTIFLMDTTAFRTTLRSIFGNDFDDGAASQPSLIAEELFKLVERP